LCSRAWCACQPIPAVALLSRLISDRNGVRVITLSGNCGTIHVSISLVLKLSFLSNSITSKCRDSRGPHGQERTVELTLAERPS
jgi:hypothetical protein